MLLNTRRCTVFFFSCLCLLATAGRAQEMRDSEPPALPNHVFFHPVLSGLTLLVPELPFMAAVTFERNLAAAGTSLIVQPILTVGNREEDGIQVTQFGLTNYLGLRRYFSDAYKGFYVQASGGLAFIRASAEEEETGDSGSVNAFGAGIFAYLGYRWTHVFVDLGGGYAGANGTVEMDSGDEVEISASGPTLDGNIGFGF